MSSFLVRSALAMSLTLGLGLGGCAPGSDLPEGDEETAESEGKAFTSSRASLLTFDFDGELAAPVQSDTTKLIKSQMFYLVGQLNAEYSVAHLDRIQITNVKKVTGADGWMKVTYHVSIPVAWGAKTGLPETFDLSFPRKIGPQSLKNFTTKYGPTCNDGDAHSVTSDNYWYHFRPESDSCGLETADAVTTTAEISVSPMNTSAKYPEYDQVWKDGVFNVIAIYGKYEDGATDPSDAGIYAYNDFIEAVRAGVGKGLATTPATLPSRPGTSATDVTFSGTTPDGLKVNITALLIDSPKVASSTFYSRYAKLTRSVDLVMYNGHAGLGANVKALSSRGDFAPGRYSIFLMNGCDTFAYMDNTLPARFAKMNPDDPKGTKYLDIISNAMPAYFHSLPETTMSLIGALANPNAPKTYEEIFAEVDAVQVIVSQGEEDNVYAPPAASFKGIDVKNVLGRDQVQRYETPVLPAGKYYVQSKANGNENADVDLHVAVGYAPTLESYDFRPYLEGSNELVEIELESPAKIQVLVHAYEESPVASNSYGLVIKRR